MTHRRAVAFLFSLGLCACGGSGGGGGGATPINLTNFQAAGDIIGQSTVTGSIDNNGAGTGNPNQTGIALPVGHVGNGSLYVIDQGNHRVLGFNAAPTGLGPNADFVIGAPDFTTFFLGGGTSATRMNNPFSCWVASNALFVADTLNERVLIYSPPPTTTNAPANLVLGQPNLTTEGPGTGTTGLNFPLDVCVAANRIVVADALNRRVMVWNGIPAVNNAPAQLVLGQPDFATTSAGTTQAKMNNPTGVWTDGTRLVVADGNLHRVLIWSTFPTVSGQPADIVLGQPDFTTATPGNGPLKMQAPISVASNGAQLFVADSQNHRVLIYSPFPTLSNTAAVGVLGQASFTNVTPNDDDQNGTQDANPTARTLNDPEGVTVIGNRLYVADRGNHRVLIFTGS